MGGICTSSNSTHTMSASSSVVRVLLLGVSAPGSLAGALADGMLQDKYKGKLKLAVFSRPLTADASDAKKAAVASLTSRGVKIINGDATQGAAVVAPLFKGFDVVVSSIGTRGMNDQRVYIEAAKQGGVRWFIPSTFGFDYQVPDKENTLALIADPKAEDLAAIKAAGMDWTIFNTVSSRAMQLSNFVFTLLCSYLRVPSLNIRCRSCLVWIERPRRSSSQKVVLPLSLTLPWPMSATSSRTPLSLDGGAIK